MPHLRRIAVIRKKATSRYIERMNFLSEKYAGMERVMVQKRLQVHLRLAAKSGKRVREAAYFRQF